MPDPIPERRRVRHPVGGKSRTKQADAAGTDINRIMEKFIKTGVLPQTGQTPRYGDFSSGLDYHAALSAVSQAEANFMDLPPHVRKAVDNDPGKFLDKVMTQEGRDELNQLGMLSDHAPPGAPEPTPEPQPGTPEPEPQP